MLGVRGSHPTTPGENARQLARIIGGAVLRESCLFVRLWQPVISCKRTWRTIGLPRHLLPPLGVHRCLAGVGSRPAPVMVPR